MKIQSLIRDNDRLVPVEVELSFVPGLPQIQFLGLPDQAIKESIHRIKSAIRAQEFEFPKAQQVLVNLRPAHLKKSSRGLELAVALGILWETEQLAKPETETQLIYGELSLSGEVFEPEDLLEDYEATTGLMVWTGEGELKKAPFARARVRELRQLPSPDYIAASAKEYPIERPDEGLQLQFPQRQAELLKLVALGEHSLLLAGPAGSGKSTIAKAVHTLLKAPDVEAMTEILKNNKGAKKSPLFWRPLVQPHHSTTPLGLIGGGVPPCKGDISRAHKGVLILDELLEFHPRAQEALREPMEEFRIRITRGRHVEEHPAEALVISTTNLCPCGDWVPQAKVVCGRSLRKCQSYMERLSGPLVDRFQILFFTKKREEGGVVSGVELLKELEEIRKWRDQVALQDSRFHQVSSRWTWDQLRKDISDFYMNELFPKELSSRRRELATLRVARTFADIDRSLQIEPKHIEKALKFTFQPQEALKRLGS